MNPVHCGCTLLTVYKSCALWVYTVYYIWILCTVGVHYELRVYTVHCMCTLFTVCVHCALYVYTVHCMCTLCTVCVHCALYVYTVHCTLTLYIVAQSLWVYTVDCIWKLCTEHCRLGNIQWFCPRLIQSYGHNVRGCLCVCVSVCVSVWPLCVPFNRVEWNLIIKLFMVFLQLLDEKQTKYYDNSFLGKTIFLNSIYRQVSCSRKTKPHGTFKAVYIY